MSHSIPAGISWRARLGAIACTATFLSCLTQPPQWMPPEPGAEMDGAAGSRPSGAGGAGGPSGDSQDGPANPAEPTPGRADGPDNPSSGPDAAGGSASVCGNGAIEPGEECEGTGCPASCPKRGCTQFTLQGSVAMCTARCVETGTEAACLNDDGCCPPGCTTVNDKDCAIKCDNGVREAGETCDPLSSCPTSCPAIGCQLRKLINQGTCAAECVNDRQQSGCCTGDNECAGNFACQNNVCSTNCRSGYKPCNGSCIPNGECCGGCSGDVCQNDDVYERFCNNGACATRMKRDCGNFRCDGDSCSSQCRSGFKECNAGCIPDNQCCGGCSGTLCQDDDVFERFCNSGTCDTRRSRDCGNFRCSGGSCSSQCKDGFKACNGNCIAESSCCGSCSGTVCQDDDEYVRFCDNGTCRTRFSSDCAPFGCSNNTCRTSCGGRTVLRDGQCVPCGGREQPCCDSGAECNSPNDGCRNDRAFFPPPRFRTCAECGFRDQPCCAGNTCKEDFFMCGGGQICG
jgi:hypothetical protein